VPDGDTIVTPSARLLPVRQGGEAAMLKIITHPEARGAAEVLAWWNGEGAARVLATDGDALLMERALGSQSLASFARDGRDDEATRILCAAAARLHLPRRRPAPELPPLTAWFAELTPVAASQGGLLGRADAVARHLLADPREEVVLHGDLHHDNVLDFGPRGWLAIDPKRVRGERGFDYGNIFTNPDMADPSRPVAGRPERFMSRLAIATEQSAIPRRRLVQWILAWTGLSAAWLIADGAGAEVDLTVAALAAAELDR
jgi:streptomycin 6-kinase